jgi:hypothetical protein
MDCDPTGMVRTEIMSDRLNESIDVLTRSSFRPSLLAIAMAIGALCGGITVVARCGPQ